MTIEVVMDEVVMEVVVDAYAEVIGILHNVAVLFFNQGSVTVRVCSCSSLVR